MQVEKVGLEAVVVVLPLGPDGLEDVVEAPAHPLAGDVRLLSRDHVDACRGGGPRHVVEGVEVFVPGGLGHPGHAVAGVHHLPQEVALGLPGLLPGRLLRRLGLRTDEPRRFLEAGLPGHGHGVCGVLQQLGELIQVPLCDPGPAAALRRRFLPLQLVQSCLIDPVRRRDGIPQGLPALRQGVQIPVRAAVSGDGAPAALRRQVRHLRLFGGLRRPALLRCAATLVHQQRRPVGRPSLLRHQLREGPAHGVLPLLVGPPLFIRKPWRDVSPLFCGKNYMIPHIILLDILHKVCYTNGVTPACCGPVLKTGAEIFFAHPAKRGIFILHAPEIIRPVKNVPLVFHDIHPQNGNLGTIHRIRSGKNVLEQPVRVVLSFQAALHVDLSLRGSDEICAFHQLPGSPQRLDGGFIPLRSRVRRRLRVEVVADGNVQSRPVVAYIPRFKSRSADRSSGRVCRRSISPLVAEGQSHVAFPHLSCRQEGPVFQDPSVEALRKRGFTL